MNILIAGASGFIGQVLVPALNKLGHTITAVGRKRAKLKKQVLGAYAHKEWSELSQLDPDKFNVVINLAGANIANWLWTEKYKAQLLSSRIESTRQIVDWCASAKTKKPHLYNASAIGVYGLQKHLPEKDFTEASDVTDAKGFGAELIREWEKTALSGMEHGVSVTCMRFGVVLQRGQGMLKRLEWPTRLGLGVIFGTGEQPISWIHYKDLVEAIIFLMAHPEIVGPVNMVDPEVKTQKCFAAEMASIFKQKVRITMKDNWVQSVFGQMGEELLLSGQAVAPAILSDHHFLFKYPTLEFAFKDLFSKEASSPEI